MVNELEISNYWALMAISKARESRRSRVLEGKNGAWGSSSQDFLRVANLLYESSVVDAKRTGGNCSIYALAAMPMLFSALRCLLIELNAGMHGGSPKNGEILADLADLPNDIEVVLKHYPVSPDLRQKLLLLGEVRNEIIHPAHRPGAEKNGTPTYLKPLRDLGLLQSTGRDTDYIWISQLQSHKLLTWAFATVGATVEILLSTHGIPAFMADGLRTSYSRYAQITGDL